MVGKRWANEQSGCAKPHKIRLLDVKVKDEARHGKAFEGLLKRYFAADLIKEDLKDKVEGIAKKLGL